MSTLSVTWLISTATVKNSPKTGPKLGNIVVEANGVKKVFGDRVLYDDLTFSLPRGGIVGVVGGNGAGKTTLFRMLMNQEQPDGGSLVVGETVKFMYVDQNREGLDPERTVFQEVTNNQDEVELGKRVVNSRAYLGVSTLPKSPF